MAHGFVFNCFGNMKIPVTVFALLAFCVTAKKRYDEYTVLEVTPDNEEKLMMLKQLQMTSENSELDFWIEPSVVGRAVHIMVGPEDETQLRWTLELNGLKITTFIQNVQKLIDDEEKRLAAKKDDPENFVYYYDLFNRYEDFMTELDNLAAKCPDDFLCQTEVVGSSYEGRDLKILSITTGADKEIFWIDSQIHAREWLSGATVMNIVNKMLTDYGTDVNVTRVVNSYNWVVLPVMNPDGYEYTWTDDRLWRKSRNINNDSTCYGTDLNRNYAYKWGTGGSSSLPCSDTYMGSSPASEPETQVVQNQTVRWSPKVWLSFHTYGYYWLIPYGDCTSPDSPQAEHLVQVSTATCDAIEATHGTRWSCGNSCEVLYATSGTTTDHVMGANGVYYAYTPELRGPGFIVDPSAIPLSVDEIWNGLVAKVDEIAKIDGQL